MGRPGGAVRPLEEIREAMAEGRMANADGTPTRAACRQMVALFSTVTDPRQAAKVRYPLNEVLLAAFLAVMCDANTWADMERLGQAKLRWLRRFTPFRAGVPSHDTFRYVLGLVDFAELQSLVVTFVVENLYGVRRSLGVEAPRRQLAVDGKAERGTERRYRHSAGGEVRNVQTLHVWDTSANVCMWSEAIEEKTNEIPVAQRWLADEANVERLQYTGQSDEGVRYGEEGVQPRRTRGTPGSSRRGSSGRSCSCTTTARPRRTSSPSTT